MIISNPSAKQIKTKYIRCQKVLLIHPYFIHVSWQTFAPLRLNQNKLYAFYMLLLCFRWVSMNHSNTVSELFEYRMIFETDSKSSKKSSKKKIALQFTRKINWVFSSKKKKKMFQINYLKLNLWLTVSLCCFPIIYFWKMKIRSFVRCQG